MRFTLEINCDNDAFELDPGAEIARILREVAQKTALDHLDGGSLHDINGNRVGEWRFEESE